MNDPGLSHPTWDLATLARFYGSTLMLVGLDGRILACAGTEEDTAAFPVGTRLESLTNAPGFVPEYLSRVRRSGSPVPTRFEVAGRAYQVHSLWLADARRFLVRLSDTTTSGFARLSQGLVRLNARHRDLLREHRSLEAAVAASDELNARLKVSESRFRTLVENSPLLIVRVSEDLQADYHSVGWLHRTLGESGASGGAPDASGIVDALLVHLVPTARKVFRDGEARQLLGIEVSVPSRSIWMDFRLVPEGGPKGGVETVLCIGTDVTDRVQAQQRLTLLANTDGLTGLPNRTLFADRLHVALRRLDRGGRGVAVMFVDLDGFKRVNDTCGHEAGDRLLRQVAGRIQSATRDKDTVARFGGDEFVVLAEDLDADEAVELAGRIQDALARPTDIGVTTSGSIGVCWTKTPRTQEEVLKKADIAMYQAKREGAGQVVLFSPSLHRSARDRMRIESELIDALRRSEFDLHYQPIVDAHSAQIVGAEALLRWWSSTGLQEPASFLPLATESRLIGSIGTWVMSSALERLQAWADEGLLTSDFLLHVNVAPLQLADPRFSAELLERLEGAGPLRRHICLEITEQMLLADHARALPGALRRLSELGLRMGLDDFGTGSSALAHLRKYPIDLVKIDRSFVGQMTDRADDRAIVEAVLAMAESLRLGVVGEGVEQMEQSVLLASLGCRLQQGYYFGRPVTDDRFRMQLRQDPGGSTVPSLTA